MCIRDSPLYDWQAMEQDGFSWWRARMASCAALYDLVRIDHFIGVVHYYAIPAGEDKMCIRDSICQALFAVGFVEK